MEKEIKAWIEAESKKLSINLDLLFGSNRKIELPKRSYLFKKNRIRRKINGQPNYYIIYKYIK